MKKSEQIIIDTALQVFTKNPNAPIEIVLEASKISRATFYKYFSSKNKLVERLMIFSLDETERLLTPTFLDKELSNEAKMKKMFEVLIPMGESFNFLNLFPEIFATPIIQTQYESQMKFLAALIGELQAEQKISSNLPIEWILEFCDAIIYAGWRSLEKGMVAPKKISDYAFKSFFNGVS